MDAHRLAEERSLAYHRMVAERIERDPGIVERARERVRSWLLEGRSPYYARAWDEVLSGAPDRLRAALVSDTAEARALRQATPFAGVLDPRERWRLWRDVHARTMEP